MLRVTYETHGRDYTTDETYRRMPAGWVVGVTDASGEWFSTSRNGSLVFGREVDAEQAMRALEAAGLTTKEAVVELTYEQRRELMTRDLQW